MPYEAPLIERKAANKTRHKGAKQFKDARRSRPGLETYQWKE